jgi:hypothetical protein
MSVHVKGSLTQLPEMPPAIELMGAYRTNDDVQEYAEAVWQTFSIDDANKFAGEEFEVIYGDSMDSIEQDLNERYSGPNGTSRVQRTGEHQPNQWHSGQYLAGRWVVLKEPIVKIYQKTEAAVIKELQDWITTAGKAVHVDSRELPYGLREAYQLREVGFTYRKCSRELVLVNFKPRQAAKTVHRSEDSVYRELMRGYFTYEPMDAIYREISRNEQWPWQKEGLENQLKDFITIQSHDGYWYGAYTDEEKRRLGQHRTRDTVEKKQQELYNCRNNCMHIARSILGLIKVARHLCRGCREDNRWYEHMFKHTSSSLKAKIELLLPHLHGCEDFARSAVTVDDAEFVSRKARNRTVREEQSLRRMLLSFCRWVRREAKHFKVAIPKRPQPPKLKVAPRKKKSKTKRRGKRTVIRGRTRKRVAEIAKA